MNEPRSQSELYVVKRDHHGRQPRVQHLYNPADDLQTWIEDMAGLHQVHRPHPPAVHRCASRLLALLMFTLSVVLCAIRLVCCIPCMRILCQAFCEICNWLSMAY